MKIEINNKIEIFNTNELPRTTDKTRAFYRRLYMIEFPHKFEGEYEQLTNPLSEFIRENTEEDVNGFIPKWIFAKVLNYWQRFKGYREWSDAEIGKEMAFLGYDTKQKALTGEDIKSMISRISRQFPTSSHMRNGGCILPALPALPASGGKSWRVWIGLTWPSIVDKPLKHEDFGTADEYFEAKG